jgi:hypothetical protein
VALEPFYVKGPAYGGLIRGVADAARLVLLHLNGGLVGETRLLSAASVAEMQRITPRGGKRDFGLGWFRAREANQKRSALVEHLARRRCRLLERDAPLPGSNSGRRDDGNTTGYDHKSILDEAARLAWE